MALPLGTVVGLTGLALSIPGLVDGCITYIQRIREKRQHFKNAKALFDEDLQERAVYMEQVALSCRFVGDMSDLLSEELKDLIEKALNHLAEALRELLKIMETAVDKEGNVKRWWLALYGKSALQKRMQEVYRRHDVFMRCLHYSVLFGGSDIGRRVAAGEGRGNAAVNNMGRLREAIMTRAKDDPQEPLTLLLRLRGDDVPSGRQRLHRQVDACLAQAHDGAWLVEYRVFNPSDPGTLRRIRDIAAILHCAVEDDGILPCRGFYPVPGTPKCELFFSLPANSTRTPCTLRDLLCYPLIKKGVVHSLSARVRLATRLAAAVLYIHTARLVHKHIRPENILICEPATDDQSLKFPYAIGPSFLMGFDFSRKEDEPSSRVGDTDELKNIYRHPERQGVHIEVEFNMLHDIYSMGVVLLEIALWRPLIVLKEDKYVLNEVYKLNDPKTNLLKAAREIQKTFIKNAQDYIPRTLGDKFRDVVVMCLSCLDGGFGDQSQLLDQDGVLVGLVFIQKILTALEEISL